MSDSFDDRKRAAEARFAHDEEMRFKAEARRAKLVGLWAAEKLGLEGDAATDYAKEMVAADFEEAGVGDLARKMMRDFEAKGVTVGEAEIMHELEHQLIVASEQLEAES